MKRLKYILFIAILVLTSCNNRLSNYYNSQAEKLEAEGKYEEAIALLDKAIKKNPQNLYALINRGVDKSILEDYNGAIEDYTKIIKISPRNSLAYLNRGNNKARLGNYLEAIEDYNKLIRIKGGYETKDGNFSYIDMGCLKDFDAFYVPMGEVLYQRGLARYYIDSLRLALNDFDFCVQKNFELLSCYYMIGMIYIAYGNMEEAYLSLNTAKLLGSSEAQEMIDKYYK